jgi:hypothetical protein
MSLIRDVAAAGPAKATRISRINAAQTAPNREGGKCDAEGVPVRAIGGSVLINAPRKEAKPVPLSTLEKSASDQWDANPATAVVGAWASRCRIPPGARRQILPSGSSPRQVPGGKPLDFFIEC